MIGYNKSEIVGKMRERVILQNRIIIQSDSGFQSEIYNDIGIYWSKIEYKTGFEEEDADKITNQQKINIILRYNILVNVNSRFVYRNELYQVEKVEYSDDRRFMTCVCVWRSSYTSIYAGSIFCSASLLAQSSLSASLVRVINYQASLNAFGSVTADINFVQKVASSLNANASLVSDINFVQKVQASLLTSANVTGDISIPKLLNASLLATGTTTADLTVNAPSAGLLLDLYPSAAAAYSLRKLRTAYTGSAIRVRRSSDNTEQDIGFVGNNLDTTALTTFCGAGNGFVTTWYDQSGNARNAVQSTQASQPQIVSSGVVLTNVNALSPCIKYEGSKFFIISSITTTNSIYSTFDITSVLDTLPTAKSIIGGQIGSYMVRYGGSFYQLLKTQIAQLITSSTARNANQLYLNSCFTKNTGFETYINNILDRSGTTNPSFTSGITNLGASLSSTEYFIGNMSEIIIYTSDKLPNKTGIQSNINTHYGIY